MSKNGTKKYGRNKDSCARYKLENRAEKSKARKLVKHIRHLAAHGRPVDPLAMKAYEAIPAIFRKGQAANLDATALPQGQGG